MEREIKLQLDDCDPARLARAPELAPAAPRRRRLATTYFDTPGAELAAQGLALRLRRDGRRWIESLKGGPGGAGGLHVREEWEFTRRDAGIDLARFAGTPLAALPRARTLHARLAPVFTVDFVRTSWILDPAPGCRLEVALDVGFVASGDRREALRELEIECLEGGVDAAFDLADALAARYGLRASSETKAARGWRLCAGAAREPVKARAVHLRPSMARLEAARLVVAAGLEQLQANEEGVLCGDDPEFVHQARIALRRTRSALRIFRDTPGFEAARRQRAALGRVARALGEARDRDVFAGETLPVVLAEQADAPLARTLGVRAAAHQLRAREGARAALRSRGYARAILALARWLAAADPGEAPADARALTDFAARVLRKRHRRLMRAAGALATLTPGGRHRLRIDVKRLRYGTDAFASLFAAHQVDEYLAALAELQDALGGANDAATALALLGEVRAPRAFAAFARGWFAARATPDPALLAALLERIDAAPHPWRHRG